MAGQGTESFFLGNGRGLRVAWAGNGASFVCSFWGVFWKLNSFVCFPQLIYLRLPVLYSLCLLLLSVQSPLFPVSRLRLLFFFCRCLARPLPGGRQNPPLRLGTAVTSLTSGVYCYPTRGRFPEVSVTEVALPQKCSCRSIARCARPCARPSAGRILHTVRRARQNASCTLSEHFSFACSRCGRFAGLSNTYVPVSLTAFCCFNVRKQNFEKTVSVKRLRSQQLPFSQRKHAFT